MNVKIRKNRYSPSLDQAASFNLRVSATGLLTAAAPAGLVQGSFLAPVSAAQMYGKLYTLERNLLSENGGPLAIVPLYGSGKRSLTAAGDRLFIFPDGLCADPLTAAVERVFRIYTAQSAVACSCRKNDGTAVTFADPSAPAQGECAVFYEDGVRTLRSWDAAGGSWVEVCGTTVRLACAGIGEGFSAGDGVTLTGFGDLDGDRVVTAVTGNYLELEGFTAETGFSAGASIIRPCPELTAPLCADGRLWGADGDGNVVGSAPGRPGVFLPCAGGVRIRRPTPDAVTGSAVLGDRVWFFTSSSAFCPVKKTASRNGTTVTAWSAKTLALPGPLSGDTVVRIKNSLFWLSAEGLTEFDGAKTALRVPLGELSQTARAGAALAAENDLYAGDSPEGSFAVRVGERYHLYSDHLACGVVFDTSDGSLYAAPNAHALCRCAVDGQDAVLTPVGSVFPAGAAAASAAADSVSRDGIVTELDCGGFAAELTADTARTRAVAMRVFGSGPALTRLRRPDSTLTEPRAPARNGYVTFPPEFARSIVISAPTGAAVEIKAIE
ncbi:MAG: hypothetical protein K6C36_09330 [Clostridia bacterium]|nr:hypothetical protein [Clostridia bacterium]